jgi:Na+/melibiose symporter-like transporter
LISTVIGVVFTVFFHIGVSEDPLPVKSTSLPPSSSSAELTSASTEDVSNTGRVVRRIKFYEWFKTREFYEVAMIYQATRLFCNLSQVYITLYLQETLSLGHQSVAVIPLVMFLGGFGATFFLKKLNKKAGRKVVYGIGFLLGVLSAIWIWIGGTRTSYKEVQHVSTAKN